MLAIMVISLVFFLIPLLRFRKAIVTLQ